MTTPHARPGFISRNTDGDLNASLSSSKEKAFSSTEQGVHSDASKTGVEVDIQDGELHHERDEDSFAEKNVPVETAADLVTQIIHLDDDPNEKSLTFRTWFLGKHHAQIYLTILLSYVSQALGFRSLHLCCKKSSISNRRQSSYL